MDENQSSEDTVHINSSFPEFFAFDFQKLSKLILKASNISSLPDVPFVNVVQLDLSYNRLTDLPFNFMKLQKLKILNLKKNQFEILPPWINSLISLELLDLSGNYFTEFSFLTVSGLYSLKALDLDSNLIETFPNWLISARCKSISELRISNNFCFRNRMNIDLHDMCNTLSYFRGNSIRYSLKRLNLSNCCLKEDDAIIFDMFPLLEELNLSNNSSLEVKTFNYLKTVPLSSMEKLENLSILKASDVSLINFSNNISQLVNLRVLDASNNHINWLPETFSDLINLEVCDLSNNDMFLLPNSFGKLINLIVLRLSSNKLSTLPKSFEELSSLQVLDLFSNELTHPPDFLHMLNLEGLDLERNSFDTKTLHSENFEYYNLMKDFREKYQLTRMEGFNFLEERGRSSSSETEERSRSCSQESEERSPFSSIESSSISGHSTESQVVEVCSQLRIDSPVENWDSADSDDMFELNFQPNFVRSSLKTPNCFFPMNRRERIYYRFETVEGQFDDADEIS